MLELSLLISISIGVYLITVNTRLKRDVKELQNKLIESRREFANNADLELVIKAVESRRNRRSISHSRKKGGTND